MSTHLSSTGNWTHSLRKLTHQCHDRCSHCGTILQKGVAAYAGYGADRHAMYVGECCSHLLTELVSHIYWWWTTYKRPTDETLLWRYMDFAKFVAILEERALFFARADNLGDKFEGARGITAREEEWRNYCLEWFRNSIITLPRGQESPLPPPEEIEHAAKKLLNDFTALGERELKSTYVNCWHANTGESEAQWRLYAPPLTSGVAIRTTFGKLDRALSSAFDIRAGYVQYIDFSKHFAGTYDRIFWKRSSLAHESEVRLVISDNPTTPAALPGIAVPIDVTSAFHSVVISPFAPSWLQGVVEATIRRFGFQLPVTPSTLLDEPFF